MKKSGLIFIVLFLVLISSVFAAHTRNATLIVYTNPFYESTNSDFTLTLYNNKTSVDKINKTSISISGISNFIDSSSNGWTFNPSETSWSYPSGLNPRTTTYFDFNGKADLVDANTTYNWLVTTYDTVGTPQQSTVQVIVLNDPTPPVLSNVIPQNNSFIQGLSNQLFSVDAIDAETGLKEEGYLIWCVHDPTGNCAPASYKYQTLVCQNNICSSFFDMSNIINFPETYNVEFKFNITDNAGNSKITSWYYTRIDRTPPVTTLSAPANGILTKFAPTDFTFTSTDNLGTNLQCELYINDILKSTKSTTSGILTTFSSITGLSEGINNWYVRCIDEAGNSAPSSTSSFTLDTIPPQITINALPTWNSGTISITHTETDANLDATSCQYSYAGISGNINCNQTFNLDTTLCPEGTNTCTLTISALDLAGNSNTNSITFSVDNSKPVVNLIFPADVALTTPQITFTYSATDTYSGISSCSLYIDGNSAETTTQTSITKTLSEGAHTWYVSCIDNVDLSSTSIIRSLTVDSTPPVVDLTSFNLLNNTNDNDGNVNIPYTVSDPSGVNNCSLYVNGILDQTSIVPPFTNFLLTIAPSNSAYNISISCTDSVGNLFTSPQIQVYYDNIQPVISNILNSSDSSTATITWDTNEFSNSTVKYSTDLSLNSKVQESTSVKQHTLSLTSLSASTLYYYKIFSTDQFGNEGSSVIYNFTTIAAPPSPSGGGGGGGGGGDSSEVTAVCNDLDFICSAWNKCEGTGTIGSQSRTCILKKGIKCEGTYKPIRLRSCTLPIVEGEKELTGIPLINSITGMSITDGLKSTPAQALLVALFVILTITAFYRWLKRPKVPDTIYINN